ncbi:MAG: TetR/AcrR family transcriptional regulator [Deltaproteobacteria bacterium]|nr:TetR/AcrR family transcriptional regulator [Deltaproteobacteria bacterium]
MSPNKVKGLDGRTRRAQASREATRARILEAAREVFARHGFHETALPDLLEAANVARGTFYLHFDSKEAAFAALLEQFLGRLGAGLGAVTTRSPEAARDELLAHLERVFALVDEERDLARLLFAEVPVPNELRHHLDRFFAGVVALIQRALDAGQALGLVRAGDTALRARLVLGVLVEAARGGKRRRTAKDRSKLAREVLEFVLAGLLRDPRAIAAAVAR